MSKIDRFPARASAALAAAILLLGLLAASCSSIPRYTADIQAEWIEGKPYPVSITFQEGKKLDALSALGIEYRDPSGERRFLPMTRSGTRFQALIPGANLVPGRFSFTISAMKGKAAVKVRKAAVDVLSTAQARVKREAALAKRISFSYEEEVPYYRGAALSFSVSPPGENGRLVFSQRKNGDGSYIRSFPNGNSGQYGIMIPLEEIEAGLTEFCLEYTEDDPDLGSVRTFIGRGKDESSPYRIRVIGREELLGIVAGELRSCLVFRHEPLASVVYDQDLNAEFDPAPSRFLKELLRGEPEIRLYCASGKGAFSEFPLIVRDRQVSARLGSADLSEGIDRYYFGIEAETAELGAIKASLPEAGARSPFALTVLGREESKRKVILELKSALKVNSPSSVKETDDFPVEAAIASQPGGLFFRRASFEDIALELRTSSSGAFSSQAKRRGMERSGSKYAATIRAGELEAGIDRYAIDVSAKTNTPLGEIEFSYPFSDGPSWVGFKVVTLEEMRIAAKERLESRVSGSGVSKPGASGAVTISLDLRGAGNGTRAYLFMKRPGEKSYRMREMDRSFSTFAAELSFSEQQAGYRYYYFSIAEDDPELGLIEGMYPKDGPKSPLEYEPRDDGMKDAKKADSVSAASGK